MSTIKWNDASVTPEGLNLQAELLKGGGLQFTRVTGADAEGNNKITLNIQPATVANNKITVPVLLSNIDLDAGFTMTQLRFYAKGTGAAPSYEILYAVAQDSEGDYIPSATESPGFSIDWSYTFQFGNADNVTVNLDPAGLISVDQIGSPNGIAPLGPDGKVPPQYLDSSQGSSLAPPYDSESTYESGDYCTHDGSLYQANVDIDTPEPWNATHWTAVNIVEQFVPNSQIGQPGGVAPLDEDGLVPDEHLPEMDYIPMSQKGAPGGVAELGADGKVAADQIGAAGGSLLTITFDEALEGLPYTLAGGEESYSGTVPASLEAVHSLLGVDTPYTLTVTGEDDVYTRTIQTDEWFTALALSIAPFSATITVTCPAGSSVTCANGDTTLTQTATSGTAVFTVGNTGTWTITATLGDESASGTVQITADGESKSIELDYVLVYGVCWDKSNSSTALSRLTKSNDPNHYVTGEVTSEPQPAVGTGAGSSPFDEILPWSGMYECNLNGSGVETAKKGEGGFSRNTDKVMVWIPEFWYKITESGNKMYFYVAGKAADGFQKHPGSGKYISRYALGQKDNYDVLSVSGSAPMVNMTRSAFRTNANALGEIWHLYDIATYSAIVLLYVVEFASWDSQSKIGKGNVNTNAAINNGGTDAMTYHTGRAAGTDGQTAVQYRGIENLWGNVYQFVDGFNANAYTTYVCTDPDHYADDTQSNYTATGITLPSSGWIKGLGLSSAMPWVIIPDESGGSETTYVPDYVYSYSSGWLVLYVGGSWSSGSFAGLLYFDAGSTSSVSNSNLGARLLCEKPA